MGELSFENIMSGDEIENLFVDSDEEITDPEIGGAENKENKEITDTTEVNVDTLFTDKPESVSSGTEENQEVEKDTSTLSKEGSSPKNFYSSIAKALQEEGIFPDLDDDITSKISTPEDFAEIVEKTIQSKFDARQKRIDDALNYGVEVTEIKRYENTIQYLDTIKDDILIDESDKGEQLRKQLIFQDFINRGYSQERAQREVTKSLNAGTDIEDAKEALKSNKEYFESQYNTMIEDAKKEDQKLSETRKEEAEKLKKSLLEDTKSFGEIQLDKTTRQKIFDNIAKPVYKDPETGELYTAIQKYEMENRTEFMKNLGLLFTLTDGFKSLDKLVKGKVTKEVKKGLRELENTLNNTSRSSDGNLKFVSGVEEDPEAFIGKGWDLDI